MSVQHTPGPWLLETVATSCGRCHKIGVFPTRRSGQSTYACVYEDSLNVGEGGDTELTANARLIAAAPDLLQALDHAARSLLSMNLWLKDNPHCGVSDGARDILIRHQKEAERAVAQAKGGKT